MAELAAVVGIGQTNYESKRLDLSMPGLLRDAAEKALSDADCSWGDIDAVIIGKAPDLFEGVMMPELFLNDAIGGAYKPMLRVHTAGSVGGSTGIVAASMVQGGIHDRVLCVAFEKQSESNATWALSISMPFSLATVAGAGGYFAPLVRGYIRRSGAPEDTGIRVAVKDRQNALKNPLAHLHLEDISFDMVANSPMLWDPIRYLETCPSSDGACAMVLEKESLASARPGKVAWIHATEMRSEPTMFSGRDQVMPQATLDNAAALYKKAGITNPRQELDCAEIYVPFSWFEPMWMEGMLITDPGDGWKMTYEGATALDGDFPVNMSGGVLSSNPIGASGLIRFAEAALQVRGLAEAHQVDGAKKALGHAYGGGSQYFSTWIVGSEKP
ncbi:MAG: thiolase domain-containing protein [bacterium]|nr:acetyl-CoA acetyltransferase [Deltaproteobacteria bacterium]MCP4907674.1 thiolase domain-containing protein [bacterium]